MKWEAQGLAVEPLGEHDRLRLSARLRKELGDERYRTGSRLGFARHLTVDGDDLRAFCTIVKQGVGGQEGGQHWVAARAATRSTYPD